MSEPSEPQLSLIQKGLRRHIRRSLLTILLFFGVGGGWMVFTELSGAVVASGRLAVDAQVKRIQHPDGGPVAKILVKNGDEVTKGQLLLELDDTSLRAEYQINRMRLIKARILASRLIAELEERSTFSLPEDLKHLIDDPHIAEVVENQGKLLRVRIKSVIGQRDQLQEQIKQLGNQIVGLKATRDAFQKRLEYLEKEIITLEKLAEKKLARGSSVLEVKSSKAELEGEVGRLNADISAARSSISELKIQAISLEDALQTENLRMLQQTRAEISELSEIDISAEKRLSHVKVRATYAGIVHESQIRAVGEVVAPGSDIMLIVPQEDRLIVEATVKPADVDQLYIGQPTQLKLVGLDAKNTPDLSALISFVSSETVEDPVTRLKNYDIKANIAASELKKIGGQRLLPGMPVEIFIETNSQTVLSYLIQPLRDQIARTFRE